MQVSLTRDDLSIPWGFRLKGGAEYNVPLSILKVNDGSPAYLKLDVGDTILCIGSINASTLKHEEALNIFRMFDYNLPLTIIKERGGPAIANQSSRPAPLVWRPPSVSAQESAVYSPSHQYSNKPPESQIYSPSHQYKGQQSPQASAYKPTISSFPSQDMSAPISVDYASYQSTYKPQFNSPVQQQQQGFNSNSSNLLMKTPGSPSFSGDSSMRPMSPLMSPMSSRPHYEPPPAPPLPPPPVPGSGLSPLFNFKKGPETPTASAFPSSSPGGHSGHHRAPSESSTGEIPSALLKAMNYSPMGKKPFTYTPGGLDLSHVRNSARVKRHDSARTHEDERNRAFVTNSFERPQGAVNTGYMTPQHQAGVGGGTFEMMHSRQPHEQPSMYVSQTNLSSNQGFSQPSNNYRDVSAPSPSFGADSSFGGGHMAPAPRVYGTLPRNFREQKSSVSSFNPEEIKHVPQKRNSESRDMQNQSFSFRMLNKWIANSESSQPAPEEPKKVSEVKKALEDEQNVSPRPPEHHNPPIYNRVAPSYSDYTPPAPFQQQQQQPAYMNQQRTVPPSPVPQPSQQYNRVAAPLSHVRPVRPPYQQVMERKYSTSDSATAEAFTFQAKPIYQAPTGVPPARERVQESDVPKYKGNQIPSKTFRYLQYLTETESVIQQPQNPAKQQTAPPVAAASAAEPAAPQPVVSSSSSSSTTKAANQATFLNETSSSFTNTNANTSSSSTSSSTRVVTQSEQHQHQQQHADTSITTSTSSASVQDQQQSASLSMHGLVLHDENDAGAGSALDSGTAVAAPLTSSAVIYASDEPISTFVDLQQSTNDNEPKTTDTNIAIEIVQKAAPETSATEKPTAQDEMKPVEPSPVLQAVHREQEQEQQQQDETASGLPEPTTTTTSTTTMTESAPIEISDF